jgi:hypothetical protein
MIGLLFGVLGPLAIPMLWKGRAFGVRGKTLLSLAVCLYTALLVGLVCRAVCMAWRAWSELI